MTVAELGFAIDSRQASAAAIELDRLQKSAEGAEAAVIDLQGAASGATKQEAELAQVTSTTEAAIEELRVTAASTTAAVISLSAGSVAATRNIQAMADAFAGVKMDFGGAGRASDIAAYGEEMDRLRAKFNPLFAAEQQHLSLLREIDAAARVGAISEAERGAAVVRANQSFAASAKVLGATTNTSKLAGHEVQNLARQLTDVGVSLSSGQSPFMVLIQQGAQIQDVLGDRGLAGIIGGVGQGIASLLTPTTLLLGGLAAAGYAASALFSSMGSDVADLEEVLKTHAKLVRDIKDAYGDAAEGVQEYIAKAKPVLDLEIRLNRDDLEQQLRSLTDVIPRAMSEIKSTLGPDGVVTNAWGLADRFKPFEEAFLRFQKSVADGKPDVLAFQLAVAAIAQNDPSPEITALAGEIKGLTDEASNVQRALGGVPASMDGVGEAAARNQAAIEAYRDAMQSLAGIALPKLSDQDSFGANMLKALSNASGASETIAAINAAVQAADRVALSNVPIPTRNPSRDLTSDYGVPKTGSRRRSQAERGADSWERSVADVEKQIALLHAEADAYGVSDAAKEKARVTTELLAKAEAANKKAGMANTEATAAQKAEIDRLAASAAAATQALEDLQNRQEAIDYLKDLTQGLMDDFRSSLAEGATVWQAFGDAALSALQKIADKLIQIAIDDLFASAFGGQQSSLLGSIGGLFGIGKNAAGTNNWRGGPTWVGERGPEIVNLPAGSQVIPNHAIRSANDNGGSNVISFAPVTTITVQGNADKDTIAQLKAELDRRDRALKEQIPGLVTKAQVRGQFQGRG